jgi:hypothetical protein
MFPENPTLGLSSRRKPGPMLSYECAQKLDSGLACAAPDDASFLLFPRQRRPSGRQRVPHCRHSRASGNPVVASASLIAVIPAQAATQWSPARPSLPSFPRKRESIGPYEQTWIPACAGMTGPLPIAATLCAGRRRRGWLALGLFRAYTELLRRESASSVDSQFPVDPHASRGATGDAGWLARRPLSPEQGIDMLRVGLKRRLAIPRRSPRFAWGPSPGGSRRYILSIIAWPKPEQDTCFEPGIRRAKS